MIQISGYFELCVMNANPCENGGTCYVEMEAESYSCACPGGWMGDRCQGMTLRFNQVLAFEWLTQNKHSYWSEKKRYMVFTMFPPLFRSLTCGSHHYVMQGQPMRVDKVDSR